ncbi:MAG: stage II sporulation protein M [Flavobacteriaceae bacterium]
MNKKILAFIFIITISFALLRPENLNDYISTEPTILDDFMFIKTPWEFLNIFINNLMVALLASVAGFFSAGLFTLVLILWNLFLVGVIYYSAISGLDLPWEVILYLSKHVLLELYAFWLFSLIGFKGFNFYKSLIKKNKVSQAQFPQLRSFTFPSILLFISAIIEAN